MINKDIRLNPIEATQELKDRVVSYINETLPICNAVPSLANEVNRFLRGSNHDDARLITSPYIELMLEYLPGNSLQELADEDVILQETADAFAKYLGGEAVQAKDIKLYDHQCKSIRAIKDDKNLLVCTGTGSGKTECFLLPLIDSILRERKEKGDKYQAHVRAMILYPMNALVNDQIRRLRTILRYLPNITFGRYTGELALSEDEFDLDESVKNKLISLYSKAEHVGGRSSLLNDEITLANEYTRRKQWEVAPADILVTNYSMLERLLIQPETSGIFNNEWDFIVLDEAHSYTGSTGTEIAWLLRRLERRLRKDKEYSSIRYLATSATLSDSDDLTIKYGDCLGFAKKLFPDNNKDFHLEFGTTCLPNVENPLCLNKDILCLFNDCKH